MKNIVVLGSTGSVGRQTLEVAAAHPQDFKILALWSIISLDARQNFNWPKGILI